MWAEAQRVEAEIRSFWSKWGRAPFHEEVVKRRLLRGGRVLLSTPDRAKAWCVADANLFLQYRMFDQVDWGKELGLGIVVLVVATSVLRALDRYKSDVDRPRLRSRAQQVLPRLEALTLIGEPRELVPVRDGVELLLLDREPPLPPGLDPADQDDRIIAAALDLRDRWIGSRVFVVSGDTTVRIKARSWGLEQRKIPASLRLPRYSETPAHESPSP